MSKKNIILVGGGGHCHSCIDVIEQCGAFNIVGVVDSFLQMETKVCGYPVLCKDEDLPSLLNIADHALVTIGQLRSSELRERLYEKLIKIGYILPSIISPLAYIARDVEIGKGTIVMHQAILNTKAKIGHNCIINTKALIESSASSSSGRTLAWANALVSAWVANLGPASRKIACNSSELRSNMRVISGAAKWRVFIPCSPRRMQLRISRERLVSLDFAGD